jgi:hypothetical protein
MSRSAAIRITYADNPQCPKPNAANPRLVDAVVGVLTLK